MTISAAAGQACCRLAVGHPVPASALAAVQASDLVGRLDSAGCLDLDCSFVSSFGFCVFRNGPTVRARPISC